MNKPDVKSVCAKCALGLAVLLNLLVLELLWHFASQLYLVDVIGQTLRASAISLAQGQPIYSAPALAMPYTPGFVLLNAVLIKLAGFSFISWNGVWAVGGAIFLLCYSLYFVSVDKVLAPFVAAGLLACLFPLIWARADIYAIGITGMGMLLLHPLKGNPHSWKTGLAVVFFALGLFFKQTMLPIIVAVIWLSNDGDLFARNSIHKSIVLLGGVIALFGLMMLAYMWVWHENPRDVLAVLAVGKGHAIRWQQLLIYSGMYILMLMSPVIYILRNARWATGRMTLLILLGAPLIVFSAKDGGGWHHFLGLLLPWLWLLVLIRRDSRTNHQPSDAVFWFVSVVMFALASIYFPFRPSVADALDMQAMHELQEKVPVAPFAPLPVLVLDAAHGSAFPESLYLKGYQPLYMRGAMEEWSGALPTA